MKLAAVFSLTVVCLVLLHGGLIERAEAVSCNVMDLTSCMNAVLVGLPPTPQCCTALKAHEPCFCQFKKDPSLGHYFDSPNAKKTLQSCAIPWPTC